jgi:hypothetical protein
MLDSRTIAIVMMLIAAAGLYFQWQSRQAETKKEAW